MIGPIDWKDMAAIVGNYGIGSFDAMIINLFLNSNYEGIITADKELAKVALKISDGAKYIFIPDKLELY